MRLAILALSAAAISGCSWYGGAHHSAPASHCATTGYGYQQSAHSYGYAQDPRCVGGMFGVQGGYAQQTHAMQSHNAHGLPPGMAQPMIQPTMQGAAGYQTQGYTAAMPTGYPTTATTLSASAPYGAAVSGGYVQGGAISSQGGTSSVKTVIGPPLYVPQPYPAPYPVPQPANPACCVSYGGSGGGVAMPFGLEVFAGTEMNVSGDIFTKKSDGPPDGDYSIGLRVGEIDPISYSDAFGNLKQIGGAVAKDLSPQTTVYGALSHGTAKGQTVEGYTTVEPGSWTGTTFTSSGAPRALDGTFSDLKLTTLEGGVRHYMGYNPSLRPYVGASAGMTHNNEVTFQQTYSDDGTYYGQRQFVDDGWAPTAAATLGAEMALGPRTAVGIESGVRWRSSMDTGAESEDRITVPLTLRGRLAF